MANYNYKRVLKGALASLGVEVKRIDQNVEIPKYFDDPIEALLYNQGGKKAAFSCPIGKCTHYTALGFRNHDWHPFVETLKQYRADKGLTYSRSKLKEFYTKWQPKNASDALTGFKFPPKEFNKLPPHYMFLSPWSSLSHAEVDLDIRWWNQKDNTEHGRTDLRYPDHGWAFFGPVHPDKGILEFDRSISLYNSLDQHGYDRSQGFVGVTILKRGNELIYLVGGGGYHRAAALSSLGYKHVPSTFHRNSVVDIDDACKWPQVRSGLWTAKQARSYVDHLFDYNSTQWAIDMNLC